MTVLDRRTFLRGLGGVSVALPFLSAMQARAQGAATFPKRLLIVYHTHGMLMNQWRPIPRAGAPAGTAELLASQFDFNTLSAPLTRHKDDLVVLGGINDQMSIDDRTQGNAHQTITRIIFTGALPTGSGIFDAGAASVDYEIAQRLYPDIVPKTRALHLGARAPWDVCYTGVNSPVSRQGDPQAVFNEIFGDVETDPNDAQVLRRRARRMRVLDNVRESARRLRRDLPQEDARLLDGYLERLRDLAASLDATASASCMPPTLDLHMSYRRPPDPNHFHPYYDWDVAHDAMMEMAVMSLACDLTRVVTLSLGQPNEWDFLDDPVTGAPMRDADWHEAVVHRSFHSPSQNEPELIANAQRRLNLATIWQQEQFARLLDRMKSFPEGDGSLLDNTLVLYANEFSDTHMHNDKPYILAGKALGLLQTGRYLRYNAQPHNRLLLTLLQMFIPEGDPIHQSFGTDSYQADGPLTGIL